MAERSHPINNLKANASVVAAGALDIYDRIKTHSGLLRTGAFAGIATPYGAMTYDQFVQSHQPIPITESIQPVDCDNLMLQFTKFEVTNQNAPQHPGRAELVVDTNNPEGLNVELTFDGAKGDHYTRMDEVTNENPITVHPPKHPESYPMNVTAQAILENGIACGDLISDARTIEGLAAPTNTPVPAPPPTPIPPSPIPPTPVPPTETPRPTDTPLPTDTPRPTDTPLPTTTSVPPSPVPPTETPAPVCTTRNFDLRVVEVKNNDDGRTTKVRIETSYDGGPVNPRGSIVDFGIEGDDSENNFNANETDIGIDRAQDDENTTDWDMTRPEAGQADKKITIKAWTGKHGQICAVDQEPVTIPAKPAPPTAIPASPVPPSSTQETPSSIPASPISSLTPIATRIGQVATTEITPPSLPGTGETDELGKVAAKGKSRQRIKEQNEDQPSALPCLLGLAAAGLAGTGIYLNRHSRRIGNP